MYEMLAHRVPFRGNNVMDVLAAIVEATPEPLPALAPEGLRERVHRGERRRRGRRHPTEIMLL